MRKTKIVCTIGPASESEETLEKLIDAGMNVARINFSHGDYEEQRYRIDNIKKVRERLGKPVALMLDTKGPEIRIGKFVNGEVFLHEGNLFSLIYEDMLGDETKVPVTYKNLSNEVDLGTTILINDGLIECRVEEIHDGDIVCRVINGGKLTDRKSINIPNSRINLPSLTEKDIADIEFGAQNGFDYIAASFIRKPQDVIDIKNILKNVGGEHIKVISKIENREGVENFDEILKVSDGIMVARGDLGVEIPMEEVPIYQKQFIKKCYSAGKPVITATQMLESMMNNPRPTRAEVSDVANAIFDMSGGIMLSGETASGKYPTQCVKTMDKIASTIENSIHYWKRFKTRETNFSEMEYKFNTNYAVCETAMNMNASAILAYTETGNTTRILSSFTPNCPIYAVTTNERIYRQLALLWGVYPILLESRDDINSILAEAVTRFKATGDLHDGDDIVIAGGASVIPTLEQNDTMNRVIGGVLKV